MSDSKKDRPAPALFALSGLGRYHRSTMPSDPGAEDYDPEENEDS